MNNEESCFSLTLSEHSADLRHTIVYWQLTYVLSRPNSFVFVFGRKRISHLRSVSSVVYLMEHLGFNENNHIWTDSFIHRRRVSGAWGGLSPPKFLAECHLPWLWKTHTHSVLFILLFFLCKFNRFADFLVKLHYTALQHLQRLVTY